MKYEIQRTTQFKKDYKLTMKRNMNIKLLDEFIRSLASGLLLSVKFRDHELTGKWSG